MNSDVVVKGTGFGNGGRNELARFAAKFLEIRGSDFDSELADPPLGEEVGAGTRRRFGCSTGIGCASARTSDEEAQSENQAQENGRGF